MRGTRAQLMSPEELCSIEQTVMARFNSLVQFILDPKLNQWLQELGYGPEKGLSRYSLSP